MGVKLTEMNVVLERLFEESKNDTLVMVIGDHGMDKKGDHGGDSFEEMNAGLFFYSKQPIVDLNRKSITTRILDKLSSFENYQDFTNLNGARTIPQIDIVSTISYLFGTDVPFGNLGMGITEMLSWDNTFMVETIRNNAHQISRYLNEYGKQRGDISAAFKEISSLLEEADAAFDSRVNLNDETAIEIYVKYARYTRQVLLKARNIWSRFEYLLICMGVITCVFNCEMVLLYFFREIHNIQTAILSGLIFSILGNLRPLTRIVYPDADFSMITITTWHEILFMYSIGYFLGANFGKSLKRASMKPDTNLIINSVLTIAYISIPGSDSFLIFEDYMLFHFVQFYHLVEVWYRMNSKQPLKLYEAASLMIILRLIFSITVCRPDQGPVCAVTFYSDPQSSVSPWWGPLLSVVLASVNFYLLSTKLSVGGKLMGASMLSSALYWAISTWESLEIFGNVSQFVNPILLALYLAGVATLLRYTRRENLTFTLYVILLIFQKPMGQTTLHLLVLYLMIRKSNLFNYKSNMKKDLDIDIWFYLGLIGFFSTGHQNQLSSVQYDTGFIGLAKASMTISPLYIWLNTVSATLILSTITLSDTAFKHRIVTLILSITSVTAFTGHFARHSQAFRVWGPKFLFYISNTIAMIIGMLLERLVPTRANLKLKSKNN